MFDFFKFNYISNKTIFLGKEEPAGRNRGFDPAGGSADRGRCAAHPTGQIPQQKLSGTGSRKKNIFSAPAIKAFPPPPLRAVAKFC